VHHSGLSIKGSIYKYLVQGEYVELKIVRMEKGEHKYQGEEVSGIYGKDLMCECRSKNKDTTKKYKTQKNK
jgi:hypothetical protein